MSNFERSSRPSERSHNGALDSIWKQLQIGMVQAFIWVISAYGFLLTQVDRSGAYMSVPLAVTYVTVVFLLILGVPALLDRTRSKASPVVSTLARCCVSPGVLNPRYCSEDIYRRANSPKALKLVPAGHLLDEAASEVSAVTLKFIDASLHADIDNRVR